MEIDTWHAMSLAGAMAVVFLRAARWPKLFGSWLAYPAMYFFGMSVFYGYYQPTGNQGEVFTYLSLSSARSALTLTLVFWLVCSKYANTVFRVLVLLHTVILPVIVLTKAGSPYIGNSHDTLAIAIFLPIIIFHTDLVLLPATILSVAAIVSVPNGATAQLLVLLYLTAWVIGKLRGYWKVLPVALAALIPLIPTLTAQDLSIKANRFAIWKPYMVFWAGNTNPLFGAGPGSFEGVSAAIGPAISSYGRRMWMHSDWMQLLFEFGLIGLVCGLVVYLGSLKNIWHQYRHRMAFLACGIGMLVYSPAQFWPIQFYMMYVVVRSSKYPKTVYSNRWWT